MRPQAIRVAGGPTKVDPDVAAVDPSKRFKSLLDDRDTTLRFWITFGEHQEHADPPHPLRLLRARRERPCRNRAAKQRHELASFHSITSWARSSTDVGSSIPSVLALLRLTTTSNFTARSIGRSAGGAPFRILSTKDAKRE